MQADIFLAEDHDALARCFPVLRELRPHLDSLETFLERVQRQRRTDGYAIAALAMEGKVLAAAGFRLGENLAYGKYLYVDDLATLAGERSRGCGGQLLDWLAARARAAGCAVLTLDSGVQRFAAHRFYLLKRMEIRAHHFVLPLSPNP